MQAQTARRLSQKACRNILRDEVDKYPAKVGKDADPLSLSEERAKSFWDIRKIIDVSSPTLEDYGIWKQLQRCERVMEFRVPCIHCKKLIALEFKNVKWIDQGKKEEQDSVNWIERIHGARNNAWYECQECGNKITDNSKMDLLRRGKWVIKSGVDGKAESIGYHHEFISLGID